MVGFLCSSVQHVRVTIVGPFCGQSKTVSHVYTESITFTFYSFSRSFSPNWLAARDNQATSGGENTSSHSFTTWNKLNQLQHQSCVFKSFFKAVLLYLGFIGGLMTRKLSTIECQGLTFLTGEATLANGDRLQDGDTCDVLTVWRLSIDARLRLVGLK